MAKLSKNKWLGVLLLIAVILLWVPIPFLTQTNVIATVIALGVAIYLLIK